MADERATGENERSPEARARAVKRDAPSPDREVRSPTEEEECATIPGAPGVEGKIPSTAWTMPPAPAQAPPG